MNNKIKEQKKVRKILENTIYFKNAIKKAKEKERKRIKNIIMDIWLGQLKMDSEKWKGKNKGNETLDGYLIFTNGDIKVILKEIDKKKV